MKKSIGIAGCGVLACCLAGWAALAWAEPNSNQPPPVVVIPAPSPVAVPAMPAAVPVALPSSPTTVTPTIPMAVTPVVPAVTPIPSAMPLPGISAPPGTALPVIEPTAMAVPVPAPKPVQNTNTAAPLPGSGQFNGANGLPSIPVPSGNVGSQIPMNLPSLPNQPAPKSLPGIAIPPVAIPVGPANPLNAVNPGSPAAPAAREPMVPRNAIPGVAIEEEKPAEPTVTNDNTTGRQEPAVSIEWVGPPTAKVGVPSDYSLVVKNVCNIPVQQVLVRVRLPQGVTVAATEPKSTSESNVLVWELGTLLPKAEKSLLMRMVAEGRGDVTPQAWVTFTGSSVTRIKVREPKLVLKATTSEKVMVGDAATFTLNVSNPGDGAAEQVKLHAVLSEGLEHARGNKVDFEIGNLAAGETRSVQLICGTKTGGVQKCEAVAEADGGLVSKDAANINVIMPRLDLVMQGPALRYLDRKALYTIKVTNPGDAPASNVTVGDTVPAGFKVLAASDGGRHDFSTRTVSWFLGEIGPGQTKEVKLEVQAINIGEHRHKAVAVGARGLRAETEVQTRVEGLSALLVELVDTEDPIEVSGETAYEIRITNTGSKTETDIKLVATVPDKMEYKSSQGPTKGREEAPRTIVFEPLEKLAPRADAIYRINVKCVDQGTVRFKIQVTSTNLMEPVIKMEATRIYSDAPEVKNP